MAGLTSTATCAARRPVVVETGEFLSASTLAQRVGWVLDLQDEIGAVLLAAAYTPETLTALTEGVDANGVRLPSQGYMALRRLELRAVAPDGVYVSDRVMRCVEEQVARRLRQSASNAAVVSGVLATWPAVPVKRTSAEWDQLWAACPAGTERATVRNRTRQVETFRKTHGQPPEHLVELEPTARFGRAWLLAAADRQLVTFTRASEREALLTVSLPLVSRPVSRKDWERVAVTVPLSANVPLSATLHTPSLRVQDGRVRVDVPWTQLTPDAPLKGHVRAIGFDWGVNTLLTATVGSVDAAGVVRTDGRPLVFDTAGATAKIHRIRRQREHLTGMRARIENLLDDEHPDPILIKKLLLLDIEIRRMSARQRNLNKQIAWTSARWLIAQAQASGATVIYGEDLRTMESRGLGRKQNVRSSNTIRTDLWAALRHYGARYGITVATVPARGTSKFCPRCLTELRHVKAPDRRTRGHKWAHCNGCGLSRDRDHAAAERVLSRGLAAQASTHRDRKTGKTTIRKTVDTPVRVTRDKKTSTPRRLRQCRRNQGGVPLRHATPATASTLAGSAVQRPAGHHPTSPVEHLQGSEVAATHMVATITWAGHGFHHHVNATPSQRGRRRAVTPST